MFKLQASPPITADFNAIRLDPTHADVVILAGESKTPIFAHAAILMHRCEYYKNALSNRWNSSDQDLSTQLDGFAVSKHIHAVLSHPDADAKTVNIVLEFIYTGIANIPADYLSRVITFADYLTLDSLKSQCLDCWVARVLSPENALEFYALATRFRDYGCQTRALLCAKPVITETIVFTSGAGILKDMNHAELLQLLQFKNFPSWMRWIFLIHWSKLKQDCIIEPVNLGITTGYDIEKALADIMQFLPVIGLYKMEMDKFSTFVLPYLSMFPLDMQKTLSAHYKLTYSGEWCDTIFSEILREDVFLDLLNRLCKQLKKPFGVDDNMFECDRLFLSSESVHINIDFHKACNGKSNTIVLIKTISGSILGGFVDTAWQDFRNLRSVGNAFLFRIDTDDCGNIIDIEYFLPIISECAIGMPDPRNHIRNFYGPCFGQ
ncbi:hypothetical protein HDU99_004494, partial [Rhizoclosmatium hyalinum]